MNWLLESPLTIVVVGVLLLILLGWVWSATGRKELLYALGAALALIAVGLVVERLVVTDREAIEATLLTIAREVESNDLRRVVKHIYSGAPELRQKVEGEMPNYDFTECRLTKIHLIEVNAREQPRTAVAEFNVIASGSFREGSFSLSEQSVPRWVRLYMVKEDDGRWTVRDYIHAPPNQFMSSQPLYDDPR
jgi:hypothetical protein